MSKYKVKISAGPLWDNNHAQEVAPQIAAAHGGQFTGEWDTVVEGEMSVVEIELSTAKSGGNEYITKVPAGPLWDNDHAQQVGPHIAASYGAEFTGEWETVVEGEMSVIEIKYKF